MTFCNSYWVFYIQFGLCPWLSPEPESLTCLQLSQDILTFGGWIQFCAFVKGGPNLTFSISYWVVGIPFASQFQVRVVGLGQVPSRREVKGRSWTRLFLKACLLNVCIPFAIQFEAFERGCVSPVPFACSVGGRFELDSFSSSMPIECLHSVCHSVWSVEKGLCFCRYLCCFEWNEESSG